MASIDLAPSLRALNGVRVVVLSDVENPLVGRRGALAVFGGQKGLPADDAEALGKYDSWMVGYGRLLDTAIVEARAQGLLRTPEGARTFGSVLGVPAQVPPAAWVPRCWHLVPSCVRALRPCSTLWDLTSACVMSTWS